MTSGPVMIDLAARKPRYSCARCGDAGRAGFIGKAHQRIGVGDVEVIANQRHAERRIEALQENLPHLGRAIAVCIAQQRDAIGAGYRGASAFHHLAHDPTLDAAAVLATGGRVRFGNEHIAIRQYIDPARVVKISGEAVDRQTVCDRGSLLPGQPRAGAILTVGMRADSGAGSGGLEPAPASAGSVDVSPQPWSRGSTASTRQSNSR